MAASARASTASALASLRSASAMPKLALRCQSCSSQRSGASSTSMIWNQAEIVSNLSHLYRLHPGDLIYTGTPAGVGAVVAGDVLVGRIEGLGDIQLTIGPAE